MSGGAASGLAPPSYAQAPKPGTGKPEAAKPGTGKPEPAKPARNPAPKPASAEQPAAPAEKPAAAPAPQVLLPDADNILVLIRTSLLTLNDAVLTGNFTVFRDKMAPSARAELSAGRLFKAFEHLSSRRVNMSGLALLAPELKEPPALGADGRLNLKGVFKNEPVGIAFHLIYEVAGAEWMLRGISVKLVTANAAAPEAAPKPAAQ